MAKFIRALAAVALIAGEIVMVLPAHSWSWTGDEDGQKLDREARHWLSTQNVCGVQLKQSYIDDLDRRIDQHFRDGGQYRQFLFSSVMSANAEYVSKTSVEEIASECSTRILEAEKAGVLSSEKRAGTRWSKVPPYPGTPDGKPPLSLMDLYGVWGEQGDKCRSFRAKTEGPYFELRALKFVPEGGGLCRQVNARFDGAILRVSATCIVEDSGPQKVNGAWSVQGNALVSLDSKQAYIRCSK